METQIRETQADSSSVDAGLGQKQGADAGISLILQRNKKVIKFEAKSNRWHPVSDETLFPTGSGTKSMWMAEVTSYLGVKASHLGE